MSHEEYLAVSNTLHLDLLQERDRLGVGKSMESWKVCCGLVFSNRYIDALAGKK